MNKKILVTAAVVLILGFAGIGIGFFSGLGVAEYYTQIDNDKIEPGDQKGGVINFKGDMDYYYTLTSYRETGEEKTITFGTSRELREGAFIRLTTVPVRGVTQWSEVLYQDLPAPVQAHYNAPENN